MEYRLASKMTFLLLYLILSSRVTEERSIEKGENDGEKLAHLPVAKTIQTEDGDTFDCVDINLQPAFDHPLLKNHKIQMKPSSYPAGLSSECPSATSNLHAEMHAIACPSGTIPIRRNDNQDLKSLGLDVSIKDSSTQANAGLTREKDLQGTRLTINVYEPNVESKNGDFSAAITRIVNGNETNGDFNSIGAGSLVYPSLAGDNFARFHVFWKDSVQGQLCYDHNCPGFVQVNQHFGLGGRIRPVSVYNGPQYQITIALFKDVDTGNWWLTYGPNNTNFGYWPNDIFIYLTTIGDKVFWGGEVAGPTVGSNPPPMGSGHFPSEGYGKAAYIRDIRIVTLENNLVNPDPQEIHNGSSRPHCYGIDGIRPEDGGMSFFFGGPGGCQD